MNRALGEIPSFIFGRTVTGLAIPAFRLGPEKSEVKSDVLILGGVHGDETEGVVAAHGLLEVLGRDYPFSFGITLVPALNLDGALQKQRKNANAVDLNRNLPSNDWTSEVATERYHPGKAPNSEPENQALVSWLEENQPKLIITLHSWKPLLNTNGECQSVAKAIHEVTGYEIKESIGYPTPGCLGTYAGLERSMPTLTYEIENGSPPEKVIALHIPALLKGLEAFEKENKQ